MVGPLRVLVVDDDVVDRISVHRALRASGLEATVEDVSGQRAALETLKERDYDVVLLDFLLPDGDGLSLLQEMRAAGVSVPVIILTGQGSELTAVELMKAGASDYLPKAQVNADRLGQAVRNVVRIWQAEAQVEAAERDRMRLLLLERAARGEAEAAQQRLAFLAEAGARLAASLDLAATLETTASLLVPTMAEWCLVDLVQGGSIERVAVGSADPAQTGRGAAMKKRLRIRSDADTTLARVISSGVSEMANGVDGAAPLGLDEDGLRPRAYLSAPLPARGRTIGALTILSEQEGREYSAADLTFVEEVARRAAVAVDNARLYRDATTARERLRHQLDVTSAITDSLAEGIVALDERGAFTFANPAAVAMLGWRADELAGKDAHTALHGLCSAACGLAQALAAPASRDEGTFRRSDGSAFPVSYAASPIVTDGRSVGWVLAFHDITERRRAESELDASRRQLAMSEKLSALGTLVSGVAHELRTPLTYIANNLFLMRSRLEAGARADPAVRQMLEDVRGFGEAAMEGVDRINALVKDLRPFTQSESGARVPLRLHDLVAGAVDLFRATQRGHVEVVSDLRLTPLVQVERGQLQRVVINLLSNAAEAMPRGGVIRISTYGAGKHAELCVEDAGTGIPPEVESRVFDPFFTTKVDGTGLGLAITRRIVEVHGGSVWFQSRPGVGTRFFVRLPPAEAATTVGVTAEPTVASSLAATVETRSP